MIDEITPHLAELRNRILLCIFAFIIAFFICFYFWENIFYILKLPIQPFLKNGAQLVFIKTTEKFFVAVKIAFFGAFIVCMPIFSWHIWRFIKPGLYINEQKNIFQTTLFASIMFILGAIFSYFFVTPVTINFLISFGDETLKALLSVDEYVGFITKIIIAFSLAFELPVIAFFLAKLNVINANTLKRHFKVSIVIIFIFAAIMTPPDVLSQFLMAIPLVFLYVLSIFVVSKISKNPQKDEENE